MKISVICSPITEVACDLLVVNEFEGVKHPGGATGAVDKALGLKKPVIVDIDTDPRRF